ncbi:MAG: hypothetical protein LUG24_02960 [Clostridiales bacterium]|nr:hypothetical protein [Clostridiales bacterium]
MKGFMRKIICAAISAAALVSGSCSVFGGEIDSSLYSKDSSYIESLNGRVELSKETDIRIENETAGSVTTKKVTVNNQKISGSGEAVISNKTETEYKNVKTPVIVDLEIDINTPIVYGDDIDVTVENESETTFEDVEAAYIYKYGYSYNNVISLPYFDSDGNIIYTNG